MSDDIIKSGTLKKKGGLFGIWNPFYCEVKYGQFVIYRNAETNNIEKNLPLNSQTVVLQLEEDPKKFRIDTPGEIIVVLQADDQQEAEEWVHAVKTQCHKDESSEMDSFNILSVLGRGFYGKVMLVQNKVNNHLYALKTIHKAKLIQSKKVHTVFNEKKSLMSVKHPFIVNLSFTFQTPSKFYLGLEYVPGGELFRYMQMRGKLPIEQVRFYAAEIGIAISYLHKNGIIYRDIKPENILLDEGGHIKLTDFGLSKPLEAGKTTSTFCGTVDYLAPEVVKKEPYTQMVDWWSYGILIYEMIYNETPFHDENRLKTFINIEKEDPYFPNDVDPIVKDFIMRLLEKDPTKRQTFDQLRNHKFWNGLNFQDVYMKKISPEYVPTVDNKECPDNFDSAYTIETPCDSIATPVQQSTNAFSGFSFVGSLSNPNNLPPIPVFV